MPGLNHKQKAFALRYAMGDTAGNAKLSAIAAGYNARTAHSCGPRLLANADVAALIETHREKVIEKAEVKGAAVLSELKLFAHADPKDVFDEEGKLRRVPDMPEHIRRAIRSFEEEALFEKDSDGQKFQIGRTVKVTFWDKPKGLELLGKHDKLFTDKVEHTVEQSLVDLLLAARAPEKP